MGSNETFTKLDFTPRQAGHDGAQGDFEHFGYFTVVEVGEVEELERGAEGFVQLLKLLQHGFGIERRFRRSGWANEVGKLGVGIGQRLGGLLGFAIKIEEFSVEGCEKPTLRLAKVLELVAFLSPNGKRSLHQVRCVFWVFNQRERIAIQVLIVALDQMLKEMLVGGSGHIENQLRTMTNRQSKHLSKVIWKDSTAADWVS